MSNVIREYPYSYETMPARSKAWNENAYILALLGWFVPIPILDIVWAKRALAIANAEGDTPAQILSIIGLVIAILFTATVIIGGLAFIIMMSTM